MDCLRSSGSVAHASARRTSPVSCTQVVTVLVTPLPSGQQIASGDAVRPASLHVANVNVGRSNRLTRFPKQPLLRQGFIHWCCDDSHHPTFSETTDHPFPPSSQWFFHKRDNPPAMCRCPPPCLVAHRQGDHFREGCLDVMVVASRAHVMTFPPSGRTPSATTRFPSLPLTVSHPAPVGLELMAAEVLPALLFT